jgi:hypothetical protein
MSLTPLHPTHFSLSPSLNAPWETPPLFRSVLSVVISGKFPGDFGNTGSFGNFSWPIGLRLIGRSPKMEKPGLSRVLCFYEVPNTNY